MEILTLDGIELAIDRRGPDGAPALLLIAGGGQSMDWWTPEFCDLLGAGELQVIRYDHRDTGQSSTSPPGRPDYTGDELASTWLCILDALGIENAHLIGMSMGGGIAQSIAVRARDRARSLTLVETSPARATMEICRRRVPKSPQPGRSPNQRSTGPTRPRSSTAYRVDAERPYAGSLGFDEPRVRALAALEVRRSRSYIVDGTNHFIAESRTLVNPADIRVPTLVLHSADDPMFPSHAERRSRG